MTVSLQLLDGAGLRWGQQMVTEHHYLRAPVDPRGSVEGWGVQVAGLGTVGCLLVARPQATRVLGFYGGLDDVGAGRAAVSRWQVCNLARVWLEPKTQAPQPPWRGVASPSQRRSIIALLTPTEWAEHVARVAQWHQEVPTLLPGFVDRRGGWHSTLASTALRLLVERVGYEYLLQRPPCFPEEPYEVRWLLSYCDTSKHRGTIYRAAGFELFREVDGMQTWRIALPPLTDEQHAAVLRRSANDPRAKRYRSERAYAGAQLALGV